MPRRRTLLRAAVAAATLVALAGCSGTGTGATGGSTTPAEATANGTAATRTRLRVLFIRAARGTAGVDGSGPNDDNLSDIFSPAGQGFNALSALLADEGWDVVQAEEGPPGTGAGSSPVALTPGDRASYDLIVFGSNNARYPGGQILDRYLRAGGSALFFQDKNYGSVDGDAARSDEDLLSQYGVTVNRDNGRDAKYTPADKGTWDHPLLSGVTQVDGFGATAFTVSRSVDGVTPTIVLPFKDTVRTNDATGSERPPTASDAAILALQVGDGRVVCTFDRDTFFNGRVVEPGNRTYVRNLFRWLSHR